MPQKPSTGARSNQDENPYARNPSCNYSSRPCPCLTVLNATTRVCEHYTKKHKQYSHNMRKMHSVDATIRMLAFCLRFCLDVVSVLETKVQPWMLEPYSLQVIDFIMQYMFCATCIPSRFLQLKYISETASCARDNALHRFRTRIWM